MSKMVKTQAYLSYKIWGGDYLSEFKNIKNEVEPLGESWEISTLPNQSSKLGEISLDKICNLNYLVKFIDTKSHLSVQVHPDDDYANSVENSSGKAECWLILECQDDAGIYLGFKEGVTRKEFFNAVELGLDVDKFLNFIPVSKGDYFFVPAGAIHAIGAGVTLCEVQQSSGVTYRVWDWNRFGVDGNPRELHIEKARDVINFDKSFNHRLKNFSQSKLLDDVKIKEIVRHVDFKVELYVFKEKKELELILKSKSSFILIEGEVECMGTSFSRLQSGFIIEAGKFNLNFLSQKVSFLVVS